MKGRIEVRIASHLLSSCAVLATALCGLAGCASISSVKVDAEHGANGLLYFLPKRDIILTVTQPAAGAKEPPTVTVQASDAVPDLEHAYVARVPRSLIGQSKATIQTNAQGLLNSETTSSLTSSLSSILQSAAVGTGVIQKFSAVTPATTGCVPGVHTRIVSLPITDAIPDVCNVKFAIRPPAKNRLPKHTRDLGVGKKSAGLFYRLAVPYVVTANFGDATPTRSQEFLVFSPTDSPTYFLPSSSAAFASNDSTFGFEAGVPTKYGETLPSELVGIVGLPASLAKSYFEAVGSMFGFRKDNADKEQAYLDSLNALVLAQQKRDACLSALASQDKAKIAEECK